MTAADKQQVRDLVIRLEDMAAKREQQRIRTRLDAMAKTLPAGALREVARRALAIVDDVGAKEET